MLDLDVHFGTGALALDLEPGRGLTDAIENPSRIDGLFIERGDDPRERAPRDPVGRGADQLAADDRRIRLPPTRGGIPSGVRDDGHRHAAQHADQLPAPSGEVNVVALVTDLTLASARDTIRLLSWLKTNRPAPRR
jgi:pilus assembly protein CpaE